MCDLETIRKAMALAARLVAELPADQWGQWVIYLCETLDELAKAAGQGDVYTGVLDGVRRDIQTRLELGRW